VTRKQNPVGLTRIETNRLRLRELTVDDGEFIWRLLNEPSFVQNIGDRGVRTIDDARAYVTNGPIPSYQNHGFGLLLVELKESRRAIGICGLLKRDVLSDPDLGYALLPEFWSKGYAHESAAAVIKGARDILNLQRVLAVVNPENVASIRLLEKLGFQFEGLVKLAEDATEIKLFALDM
jgi:ribosomal-protein-alanine N-acetyltransferase